ALHEGRIVTRGGEAGVVGRRTVDVADLPGSPWYERRRGLYVLCLGRRRSGGQQRGSRYHCRAAADQKLPARPANAGAALGCIGCQVLLIVHYCSLSAWILIRGFQFEDSPYG